jgi:4'-phosphopantetheinyl transferase
MADTAPRAYWLMQTTADVPLDNEWLAPAERVMFASLRTPKRRREWRLGRWTAKVGISHLMATRDRRVDHPADIVICAYANGAPYCCINGQQLRWPLSLSHRGDRALFATAPEATAVGCDLELVEARDDAFTREWFTRTEQDAVAHAGEHERDELITLVWSAKESALKAMGTGLTVATDVVTVSVDEPTSIGNWRSFRATRNDTLESMRGWWRTEDGEVITLIMTPPSALAAPSSIHLLDN